MSSLDDELKAKLRQVRNSIIGNYDRDIMEIKAMFAKHQLPTTPIYPKKAKK
jgi:hypothetical protein